MMLLSAIVGLGMATPAIVESGNSLENELVARRCGSAGAVCVGRSGSGPSDCCGVSRELGVFIGDCADTEQDRDGVSGCSVQRLLAIIDCN
jgi:hypothetical protein